jgi:hypothetical protein
MNSAKLLEELSGSINSLELSRRDLIIKHKAVIEYCEPHLDQMWAARIVGILLGCDFGDAKENLKYFFEFCENEGI